MRPALILLLAIAIPARAQSAAKPVPIDDFEAQGQTWKFVGGEEFPGAKGSFEPDTARARSGKTSMRLEADFRGGGAYVGCWKDLTTANLPDVDELRLWVQAKDLDRVGVRLVDSTGQCHQRNLALPAGSKDGWRELVLKVGEIAGGEHWDGSNDGVWHGPPRAFGLNIGKGDVARSTLWIDDVTAVPIAPGRPTLVASSMDPKACRPGYGTRISYVWDAEPVGANCSVFVHFVNVKGQMVFQADHDPPVPTSRWSGRVEYARTANVPANITPGRYDVVVGLWDGRPSAVGGGNKAIKAGSGVTAISDTVCKVGTLEVSDDAPLPKLTAPSLKLDGFKLTFDEDFNAPLSISAWGPGTRWIAHTPYGGDFGDARFGDPGDDSPFSVRDGMLTIEAKKVGGKWRSGLICSVDPKGQGFSQKYGYFEMRARLPKGLGTWPAFWLMGVPQLVQPRDKKTIPQVEIDVVEQYGVGPQALHTTIHLWGPGDFHWAEGDTSIVTGMTDDFHTYGVLVEEDFITFFFDGSELRKDRTPKDAKVPLYLMVDLALGGGWPIDKTPDPSRMVVDYVRAYTRR